jgi:hypothetical protein
MILSCINAPSFGTMQCCTVLQYNINTVPYDTHCTILYCWECTWLILSLCAGKVWRRCQCLWSRTRSACLSYPSSRGSLVACYKREERGGEDLGAKEGEKRRGSGKRKVGEKSEMVGGGYRIRLEQRELNSVQ